MCCTFQVGRDEETRGGCPGPAWHGQAHSQERTETLLPLEMILSRSGTSMAQTDLSVPGWWPGGGWSPGLSTLGKPAEAPGDAAGSSASALHAGCGVGFVSANEVNPVG